ncbi:quinone-dependent dihydroorotate dehydrogenase [Prosthecomicrobium sp. N25]|uniref:quinone-dependent dihydroorotate dehydrogenase n=1 Tax=Prosthecomicrobium sp. N25 TaxID=3129254 RepID=UPI003077178D
MSLYALARGGLFALDAETAHGITLRVLATGLLPACPPPDRRLAVRAIGLDFPGPVGVAAGLDKNGEVPDALLALGCGFAEVGTVTPRPQGGNPRPRLFRLPADRAVINRMGFNNQGHAALRGRLLARKARGGIVGVNIGANKDTVDRPADYVAGIEAFADLASYFTVNVSSPNTPGLRDLQARGALAELLVRCLEARDRMAEAHGRRVPVLLKVAPDMDQGGIEDVAAEALDKRIDGLILTNTTLARDGLRDPAAREAGGLSGRPLFERSTRVLARMRRLVGPDMLLVGVGGIDSGETALAKIEAGANLIQLYSGLVYEGPGLIGRINRALAATLDRERLTSLAPLVGRRVAAWT